MSKFIERLMKVGEQSPSPIGFGLPSGQRDVTTEIVLVARVVPGAVIKSPKLADSHADAYSLGADLSDEKGIEAAAEALRDQVWGLRPSEKLSLASGQELAKKGCDFVVLESWDAEASLLNEEDLGVLGTVRVTTTEKKGRNHGVPAMDEEEVHALSQLTHGLLFSPALRDLPLSVETAVDIQRILSVVDKPLIVEAPEGIGSGDIELLRNMGISGLIVDLNDQKDLDKIATIKEAIATLPRRKSKSGRADPLIPQTAPEMEAGDLDQDEDDDF